MKDIQYVYYWAPLAVVLEAIVEVLSKLTIIITQFTDS